MSAPDRCRVDVVAAAAVEHVSAWATGGEEKWPEFAASYFKKAQSRLRLIEFIDYYTLTAINSVGDANSDTQAQQELLAIGREIKQFVWPHDRYDRRVAAKHAPAMHRIFADHWLARGLGEIETVLATPENLYARLEELGRRFDRQIGRLRRLRNSAIHAGPVSDAACKSVASFAFQLGHQCLNQAMNALLTGRDIPSHIADYRADAQARYELVRESGDINDLFVPGDIETEDDGDDSVL